MSLFKVRDCWSTECGRGTETFGCDCLAVDDLFGAGEDNVILGSFDGVLRVYGMHAAATASDLRYSPSDLLVEVHTESPVLQVCTGKFVRSVDTRVNQCKEFARPLRIGKYLTYPIVSISGGRTCGHSKNPKYTDLSNPSFTGYPDRFITFRCSANHY